MNKIKCDCGHKVDPVVGQPKPLMTFRGATKNYITCPRCKRTMIVYKLTDGNFGRSRKREEREKQRASRFGINWTRLFQEGG